MPVRYKVPPRNDLIAFALMALAFGLMVGLAIAPGWGNAGSTGPVIALPAGETPQTGTTGETTTAVAAALQPPAGGEATTIADDGGSSFTETSTDPSADLTDLREPEPEVPVEETPENTYTDPPVGEPEDETPEPGPALTATVVGADDAGYAVADGAGNLLYIHYPNPVATAPKVGKRIATDIDAVDNGTFVQSGSLESKGSASSSKLSGMVSFIDPDSGVVTVSSRGVSVAVAAAAAIEKSASPPVLGSWVTGTISFVKPKASSFAASDDEPEVEDGQEAEDPITIPAPTMKTIEAAGDPLTEIELSGPVSWDAAGRILTIGADGFGALNRELEVRVPKKLALKKIEDGLSYAASVKPDATGILTLAGLSANFSLNAAADPKHAFGTHSR